MESAAESAISRPDPQILKFSNSQILRCQKPPWVYVDDHSRSPSMAGSRLVLLSFLCAAGGAVLLAQTPTHPASSNPHLGNRESIRAGMALYRVRCGDCHGLDATGYRGTDLTAILSGGINDERLF